jgi:hypothetical protein
MMAQREPGPQAPAARRQPDWCLDPRSLSAFRVFLGLGLLFDLTDRFILVPYMFCDAGFFPASAWLDQYGTSHMWSVHLGLTTATSVRLLVAVQMVLALMLVIGRAPAVASLLGWVLLLSLNFRTPSVLYGGDFLATKLLLLSALIPPSYVSRPAWQRALVTSLFLVQISVLYAGAGISKLRTEIWTDGSALSMAAGMHAFARPYATNLQFPEGLLWAATILTPWAQIATALMVWWPRTRLWAVVALMGMNVGIFSLLLVGWFMFYATALLLAAVPSGVWDRLTVPRPAQSLPGAPWADSLRFASSILVLAVFLLTASENALQGRGNSWPTSILNTIRSLDLYQRWNVFTTLPTPPGNWTVAAARDPSGKWINILDGGSPVEWAIPASPPAKFAESHRWRSAVSSAFGTRHPAPLVGRALVDSWNRANPSANVTAVRLFRMRPSNNESGYRVSSRYEWPSPTPSEGR